MATYRIICTQCNHPVLTVASVDDSEAAFLFAHLIDFHPSIIDDSTSFGDLLQNFAIVRQIT